MSCVHTRPTTHCQRRAACRGGDYPLDAADVLLMVAMAGSSVGLYEDEGRREAVGAFALAALGELLTPGEYDVMADQLVAALNPVRT